MHEPFETKKRRKKERKKNTSTNPVGFFFKSRRFVTPHGHVGGAGGWVSPNVSTFDHRRTSQKVKVRMGRGPKLPVGKEIPVIPTIFPGFNGQGGPNRRPPWRSMPTDGKTRSPTALLRSARDLHFDSPTF